MLFQSIPPRLFEVQNIPAKINVEIINSARIACSASDVNDNYFDIQNNGRKDILPAGKKKENMFPLQFLYGCDIIFKPYRNDDWVPCDLSV